MNKRKVGSEYEDQAANYLEKAGCRILERNFRSRSGEIDIICRDRERAVRFVEVKYRNTRRYGAPEEAVDSLKQRTICRTARYYLLTSGLWNAVERGILPVRFDVISIRRDPEAGTDEIRWIRDAFPFIP